MNTLTAQIVNNMLWRWNGYKWKKNDKHSEHNMLDGYICAPGPSFSDYNLNLLGRGTYTLGINSVYPYYKPDMWIGMDKPSHYDKKLWMESFPKICRGSFNDEIVDKRFWREYPETYFLRVTNEGDEETLMNETGPNSTCIWMRSTFISALHLMIWMGFKTIYLVGTNFGGDKDYFHDAEITEAGRKKKRGFMSGEVEHLEKINSIAKLRGIEIISSTYDSPVNEFLTHKEFKIATQESEIKYEQ